MEEISLSSIQVLVIAVLVLWIGRAINDKVRMLEHYSIPIAVSGGLVCSLLLLILKTSGGPSVTLDMQLRDELLLVFFSTIGLSAKFHKLAGGGKPLIVLIVCATVFLVVQNAMGVLLAYSFGAQPGLGLFAGSISFAGGHGTAIAWGREAANIGIANAADIGILFATFGLIAGGLLGGPFAEILIRRNRLRPNLDTALENTAGGTAADSGIAVSDKGLLDRSLDVLFTLALCVLVGESVNTFLFEQNFKLPGFLTAMAVGIILTNLADSIQMPLNEPDFRAVGIVSLQLFLAMSLMNLDLMMFSTQIDLIMAVLIAQLLLITLFAEYVVFRAMGRDYDAAVIAGGFCGLGMGATPVAIANMSAITAKHGPSFRAFLLIPLVGAFFIDVSNALIIKFFLSFPFMGADP